MSTTTPLQRAVLARRLREVNALIQDGRMSMNKINELQKERTALSKQVQASRRGRYAVNTGSTSRTALAALRRLASEGRTTASNDS